MLYVTVTFRGGKWTNFSFSSCEYHPRVRVKFTKTFHHVGCELSEMVLLMNLYSPCQIWVGPEVRKFLSIPLIVYCKEQITGDIDEQSPPSGERDSSQVFLPLGKVQPTEPGSQAEIQPG